MIAQKPFKVSRGIVAIVATVLGLTAIATSFWPDEPTPIVRAQGGPTTNTVFGPGRWVEPPAEASTVRSVENNRARVPGEIFATEDRELIVNTGLLEVINFYLLEQPGDNQTNALSAYLKRELPAPACDEALQIAARYQTYMKEHDRLLAAQNFGVLGTDLLSLDIGRVRTWAQQRQRLRQRILGDKVEQAWYQNDDAQLQQVLDELQRLKDEENPDQQQDSPTPASESTPQFAQRGSSGNVNEQRTLHMKEVLDKAGKSLIASAREHAY